MSQNIAIAAQGAKLQRGNSDGPPETFTTISDEIEVNAPGISRPGVPVTHSESPGNYAEKIYSGIIELKPFTVTVNYKPTDVTQNAVTGVQADLINKTIKNYKFLYPDNSFTVLPLLVTDFQPMPSDAKAQLKAQITFDPSGQPTALA